MLKVNVTRGPWKWVGTQKKPNSNTYLRNEQHANVLVVFDAQLSDADAALIAAAPDLLESCEECLMHLDWAFGLNPDPGPNFYKVAKMRAAIAKAKGEQV